MAGNKGQEGTTIDNIIVYGDNADKESETRNKSIVNNLSVHELVMPTVNDNYEWWFLKHNFIERKRYDDVNQWYFAQPKLISASANGFVGLTKEHVLKFPLGGKDTDPIEHDAFFHAVIQDLIDIDKSSSRKQHFAAYVDFGKICVNTGGGVVNLTQAYFPTTIPLLGAHPRLTYTFKNRKIWNTKCKDTFCLVSNIIQKPISLDHFISENGHGNLETCVNALIELFETIAYFAEKYGFTHGDLHEGNVLWDETLKCLCMIDFGRSNLILDSNMRNDYTHTTQVLKVLDAKEAKDAKEVTMATDVAGESIIDASGNFVMQQLKVSGVWRKYTKEHATNPDLKMLGAALDIGGLLWYYQQQGKGEGDVFRVLLEKLSNESTALNAIIQFNKSTWLNPISDDRAPKRSCVYYTRSISQSKQTETLKCLECLDSSSTSNITALARIYIESISQLHKENHKQLQQLADTAAKIPFESGIWLPESYDAIVESITNSKTNSKTRDGGGHTKQQNSKNTKARRIRLIKHNTQSQSGGDGTEEEEESTDDDFTLWSETETSGENLETLETLKAWKQITSNKNKLGLEMNARCINTINQTL